MPVTLLGLFGTPTVIQRPENCAPLTPRYAPDLPALSDLGKLHLGSKIELLVCLEGVARTQSDAPTVTSVFLDVAVIVQMLKLGTAKTFGEHAH